MGTNYGNKKHWNMPFWSVWTLAKWGDGYFIRQETCLSTASFHPHRLSKFLAHSGDPVKISVSQNLYLILSNSLWSPFQNVFSTQPLLISSTATTLDSSDVISCLDYCNHLYVSLVTSVIINIPSIKFILPIAAKIILLKGKTDNVTFLLKTPQWLPHPKHQ